MESISILPPYPAMHWFVFWNQIKDVVWDVCSISVFPTNIEDLQQSVASSLHMFGSTDWYFTDDLRPDLQRSGQRSNESWPMLLLLGKSHRLFLFKCRTANCFLSLRVLPVFPVSYYDHHIFSKGIERCLPYFPCLFFLKMVPNDNDVWHQNRESI